jgi:hypothetical protein
MSIRREDHAVNVIRRQLASPAMIVACVSLVVALGGVSYAAGVLPKNSVGAAQLQKNAVGRAKLKADAVTGAKIKDGSLMTADFKAGQLPAGPQGPAGAQGPKGDAGPAGPSDVYTAKSNDPCGGANFPDFTHTRPLCHATLSLSLPPGDYAVAGKVVAANANTTNAGEAQCSFNGGGDISSAHVPNSGETTIIAGTPHHFGTATLYVQQDIHLAAAATVSMTCTNAGASDIINSDPNNLSFGYERLRAIRVGAIH